MANKHTRQVKLHSKYRASRSQDWFSNKTGRSVPWLNVSGAWLEELGFRIGDTLRITTREKLLIIEPLAGDAREAQAYKETLKVVKQTVLKLAS